MNDKIIYEFNKLLQFIDNLIYNLTDKKIITANKFRSRQIKNVISILNKYPKEITKENYIQLLQLDGIGKGTIDRIKEILENGFLSELKDVNISSKDQLKDQQMLELEKVVGIGPVKALEFSKKGITSIIDLKNKIKNKEIQVNDKILLGLKYYGKFEDNIPREEITSIYNIIKSIIDKINLKFNKNNQFIFEIAGSYRREKLTSGDIDILICKLNSNEYDSYLDDFLKLLKNPIHDNNNKPLIIDDITEFGKTKYMGFLKYLNNPNRRIDIRFIPYNSWYSALLYFTGSAELNKKMRLIAKKKHLKLSEYGIIDINTKEQIKITSEQEIFKILDMNYLPPNQR